MTHTNRTKPPIGDRIYDWTLDFEWNWGIPFEFVVLAASTIIATTAVIVAVIAA